MSAALRPTPIADPAPDPLSPCARAGFSAILDVRSPSEFAEDHVPGAINLPVLDDAERARVGTHYVQVSKFEARRLGAALVAKNIARHLEGPLADKTAAFAPLVYCWRGGQRSGSMATVLKQIGWRAETLAGGYKTYRRRVLRRLYEDAPAFTVVTLDGDTGSGKTEILGRLAARGAQVLDLEDLAAHRGSLFGAEPDRAQPSQKLFESRLLERLEDLDWSRPIVVEAESNKIGARMIPPLLWKAMAAAPRIALAAPAEARARYLLSRYPDWAEDRPRLDAMLGRLTALHGHERVRAWRGLAAAGADAALAEALIREHYDPAYARSRGKRARPTLATVRLSGLAEGDQEAAADAISEALSGSGPRGSAAAPGR